MRIRKDTTPRRFGTLRPRVQIPGPRPYFEFSSVKHTFTDGAGGHNRVTDVSQILEDSAPSAAFRGGSQPLFEPARHH